MPIASTLEPLTDSQVAAYRRLPGDFGTMLQVCFNDGWNGCHAHMTEEIVKLDARVEELEAELLAYKGECALLKLEIESLRRNDSNLNRE